jgi:hypothetical protein
MQDILILLLQFFYAFGGLILIGSLIFNIIKNQALVNEKRLRFEKDFEVELNDRLAEEQPRASLNSGISKMAEETGRHDEARIEKGKPHGRLNGFGPSGHDVPLRKRQLSVRKGVVEQGKMRLYAAAAGLAARGFNAEDIRHRVGLPQCEIDLIAGIYDTHARERWERHQAMMDAIDAGH